MPTRRCCWPPSRATRILPVKFSHAERIAERRWSVVLKNGTRIELGADREVEGMDQVASNSMLRRAVADGATSIDVRTAGRAIRKPLRQPRTTCRSPAPLTTTAVHQP